MIPDSYMLLLTVKVSLVAINSAQGQVHLCHHSKLQVLSCALCHLTGHAMLMELDCGVVILVQSLLSYFNTLRPNHNGCHIPHDIFKCIFVNENIWILIKISLKFVPKGQINNIPALVQIMAWRRPGDKPLSEPMMVNLLTHICFNRPQWVNSSTTERCASINKGIFFKLIMQIISLSNCWEIAFRRMPLNLTY